MADMLGAIATVKNGCLLFILPGGGVTASGQALPSLTITRSSGDRHRFRIADRDAYTGVQAYWLDLDYGKKKKVKVTRRKTAVLKAKSSSREGDYIEGAEGNVFVLRKTFHNEAAAEFSITLARWRADLYPGLHAAVSGFKTEIDNQDWVISRAEHVIDDNGFTTQLEFEAKMAEWIAETG